MLAGASRRVGMPLQSGQTSRACSIRWVGAIRIRAKPCSRGCRASFLGGCWAEGGLLPGMPGEPGVFNRASKAATRCCNCAIVACCSAMIISRASRLALARSSFVSTPLVYHDYTPNARIFPASLDLLTS